MIDIGIKHGDLVVIRKQNTAENGDIIVAMMNGETTLKRFYKRNGKVVLHPENKEMKDIIVKDCEIQGVLVKYYKGRKKIIEKDRILEMYKYLVLSSKQSYDKWMKRCRDDLFNYCKLNYTEYMALFDIAAFDKFKVENRMSLIS